MAAMYQASEVSVPNAESDEVGSCLTDATREGRPRRFVLGGCRSTQARTGAVAVIAAIMIGGVIVCPQVMQEILAL